MPRISFEASEGSGWEPLPKGTYDIRIDDVTEGLSKQKETPSLIVKGHVEGGSYDQKEVTIFYPLVRGAGFRVKNLIDAAGIDFEEVETGEVNDKGKPVTSYNFDSDNLVNCLVRFDVTVREYPQDSGKMQNDFTKERSPDATAAQPPSQQNGGQQTAPAARATQPASAGQPQAPAQARRVRR